MLKRNLSAAMLLIFFQMAISVFPSAVALGEQKRNKLRDNSIQDSIVKIFVVKNQPDYFRPWNMMGPQNTTGSGGIIEGNLILTNAHVVSDSTFIQVRRYGQTQRYQARVLNTSHDADLALLEVEEKNFFSNTDPLKFGEMPDTQEEVVVYGFPVGGNSLSVTKGILSRIEHRSYIHSSSYLLAGQIDAAINPGNSGGPVVVNGRIVGVVMQGIPNRQNIGYMVPTPIIRHFLQDIKDGEYNGIPALGIATQKMESPVLKRYYRMSEEQTGIVVNHIYHNSSTKGILKVGDVLLSIGNHDIADDGTVEFRNKERTLYTYLAQKQQIGEDLEFKILREGKVRKVTVKLKLTLDDLRLVPREQYDKLPQYFIYGGFVFAKLSLNYLKRWKNWRAKAPKHLLVELEKRPTDGKREVVIIHSVLADKINRGYHRLSKWIVRDVNGKSFKDFNEFYELVTKGDDKTLLIRNEKKYQVVIDRDKAETHHDEILNRYRIKLDRSPDLM